MEALASASGGSPKLRRYYYIIQILGLLLLAGFAGAIYSFPDYFGFLGDVRVILAALLLIIPYHAFFFVLQEVFKKKIFFAPSRYGWVLFWLVIVLNSGGVHSQFLFLLMFPLLVSAVDLEERATKYVGIIMTVAFAGMIFAVPTADISPDLLVKHAVRTLMFALISYFAYKMVKETLRQKYEKDQAEKRLVELVEVDRVKTDFITVAQHQLRTPLSGARWGLDNILAGGVASSDTPLVLRQIAEKVNDAINIVNEMLKTAEVGKVGLQLRREPISLPVLLQGITRKLDYLINQKAVSLWFKDLKPLVIQGDVGMLEAALTNVIDNAIRYTPKGKVTITLSQQYETAVLLIEDDGIGIPEGDQPYIFERFYRAKNAIDTSPNESGVGLYVTKKIVELHRGSITVHPRSPRGTEVKIVLPLS